MQSIIYQIINQISIPLYSRRNFIMFSLEKIWFGVNYGLQDPICDIIASLRFSLTFYNLSCSSSLITIFIKNKHINEEPQQQKKNSLVVLHSDYLGLDPLHFHLLASLMTYLFNICKKMKLN